ncbi:MAG: sensor histidine kinase [Cyclobacteriaceae bacterium]
MSKNKIYWICQVGGWLTYALLNLFVFALTEEPVTLNRILGHFLLAVIYIMITHGYRYYIIRWGWLKIISLRLIPKVLGTIVLLSIITSVVIFLQTQLLEHVSQDITQAFLVEFFITFILYLLWSLIYFMYHYFEKYRSSLKYEAAINEIQLQQLKSQLNPHFIFNGLNSIRGLIDEDPKKAKQAINQLSNLLRNSLGMDEKRLVGFQEELNTVQDYLDLENVRYEERLKTNIQVHPDSNKFEVPPLMIQTLIENGIKHGIATLKEGGTLELTTDVTKSHMTIRIRNSGQYQNGKTMNVGGYGLANTKKRLKLLYGDKASLKIFNESDQFVMTEVRIPHYY